MVSNLKFFSKRCDFWKFSNLRKVLKYNCFQNITDSHKLNYFKILMFFLKNLLFERTHLLFENSSTPKTSSTFQKLIYFKKLIYFSETHLLQKTHLLLKNSSTFCQKEYLFKKSHGGKEKESDRFGLLFRVAFFFVENDLRKNTRRGKKNKATNIETLPNKYLRETHVPYFKKILEDEESYGNLNERLQMEEEVARYSCLDILGLRLELDKAVKWLYNTSIWNCFELLLLEAKFAFAYRTFRIEILASSKVKT